MPKKEIVSFRKNISPGEKDYLASRVKANGQIEEVRIRFYSGTERTLHLRPFIEHKGHRVEEMLTYVATTEPFLSGDDDYLVFPVMMAVEYDDYIKVFAENTDSTYTYTCVVDVVITYFGEE